MTYLLLSACCLYDQKAVVCSFSTVENENSILLNPKQKPKFDFRKINSARKGNIEVTEKEKKLPEEACSSMAEPGGAASFSTQANALLRKNLIYQKRKIWSNVRMIMIPFFLCLILVVIQVLFDKYINNSADNRCGCRNKTCGFEFSTPDQALFCAIPNPRQWPPLLQVPRPESRALTDPRDDSCRRTRSCPVTILFTGNNRSLGTSLRENLLTSAVTGNSSDLLSILANNVLGTTEEAGITNYLDPGIASNLPIYNIQPRCIPDATIPFSFEEKPLEFKKELRCVQGLNLWRNTSVEVNDEIFKGYRKGNSAGKVNEIAAAYDLLNTDKNNFNVNIWYNSTYKEDLGNGPIKLVRVARSVNLVSNSYLQFLQGPGTRMLFEYIKEMPKQETRLRLDIASLIGPLFFTFVILLLFPVILSSLVYEKQERLRIIMKMHGLGDGPYWMISYAYFLTISVLYFICLLIFGSAIGLNFFRLNDYSLQFTFYFLFVNLQIALCFLVSSVFSKVKTSTVVAYIYVYGSGLVGLFLLQFLIEDSSFPRGWIIVMELFPGFSLYRGLYEFSQFAFLGNFRGTDGMKWKDFSDSAMVEIFCIIIVEWFIALIAAFYIDKISSSGKNLLFFLKNPFKKTPSLRRPSLQRQGSKVFVEMEKPDVTQESEKVEQLIREQSTSHAIVCDNLKKVYPGRDGNPPKLAVRGLSLAVPSGECFGMLGPNGAGKTSFINMMTGLLKPTSGTGLVRGLDIRNDMDRVYTSMGVCPQHDLLWETLTGREHLLFYGRLKNLKGSDLKHAVEESLKSVNLFNGGVSDRPAGKYSGGMKRRLSVAISLIGNPKVVYMDEPSTGLDPASRKNLWTVIKRAKQHTAIILTTHSMEEAEFLCDRLGIFVDGGLQCIGNPKELKGRYGGSYVFTMTTSSENDNNVEKLIQDVSPNAKKMYHIAGTQKFELPKEEVRISEVFQAVEKAKSNFTVFAWGLADTTLEDVFIKVATTGQAFNVFS